jgi:hypothetical protein
MHVIINHRQIYQFYNQGIAGIYALVTHCGCTSTPWPSLDVEKMMRMGVGSPKTGTIMVVKWW